MTNHILYEWALARWQQYAEGPCADSDKATVYATIIAQCLQTEAILKLAAKIDGGGVF